ncbi:amidohydrolase family protein [Herbiconiux liukaitaii]|uniref:amidohydrolase family protein n=1 Tax=Herbiconiux liukaitaii TaxID=3342799 RepID=UPI0035B86589
MTRILLAGARIVSMDPAVGDIDQGDILIEGDVISAVGSELEAPGAEVLDASGWIVVPGFVDTHRHTWQSAIRHSYADIDPLVYFTEVLDGLGTRYSPEDVRVGTLLGAVSALSAGTTTLFDWAHIQNSPAHSDAGVAALRESGIRGVFGHGWPLVSTGEWTVRSELDHPADIRRVGRELEGDPLLTLALSARGPEMATDEVWRNEVRVARDLGIRISVHAGAYARNAELHAVEQYHAAGLLAEDFTIVHCNHLSDSELDRIAETGATVSLGVHCELNSQGMGDIPLDRLLSRGIRPSLSGDTETKCSGDMFTQMRSLFGYYRSWIGGGHSSVAEPVPLRLRDVLEFATMGGARALGLADRIGSITPGKQADLVCIRAGDLNLAPVLDPVAAVVLGAHEGNVDTVFVAGARVKRLGRMVSHDVETVVGGATASQERLIALRRSSRF